MPSDPEAFQDPSFTFVSGFASYDLGFATLENRLSQYDSEIPARFVIGTPLGLLDDSTLTKGEALTNELRLVSNGAGAFQWVTGIFYRDTTREFSESGGIGTIFTIPPSVIDVRSKSIAYFGEASYGFADDLVRVLVGARYFRDRRHFEETISGVLVSDVEPKFSSFNPRLNITVKPNDDYMYYFNAAKGFRSGIINTAASTAAAALGGVNDIRIVEDDSIWTYEVGSKVTVLDRTLFLEGAVYYSEWDEFQLQGISPVGFAYMINGGDAKMKGVELGITWSTPISGLSTVLSGGYVDAEFDVVNPALTASAPEFVAGERLPGVPEWSGSLSVSYNAPLGGSGLDLIAGGVFTFRDGQKDATGQPGIFTDPSDALSLRVGVKNDRWELIAFMENVTDSTTSLTSLTTTQWASPIPRTVGLRLSATF